jgi:glutaredoxin
MKKIVYLVFGLIIFMIYFNLTYTSNTWEIELNIDTNNTENVIFTDMETNYNTSDPTNVLNIKESSYIYYYGQWCDHCANVDEYLAENDLYNKLNITKKEVWSNAKNAEEMEKDLKRLGLDVAKSGVPFIVWTIGEKQFPLPIGDRWIIEYFTYTKEILDWNLDNISYFDNYLTWENSNLTTTTTETNRTAFIIILLILAIIIPTLLIKLTNRN